MRFTAANFRVFVFFVYQGALRSASTISGLLLCVLSDYCEVIKQWGRKDRLRKLNRAAAIGIYYLAYYYANEVLRDNYLFDFSIDRITST